MCDIDSMNEVFKKDYEDAMYEYQKAKDAQQLEQTILAGMWLCILFLRR